MADLFEALIAKLGGEATITAIVGSSPKRIYAEEIPQGATFPLIVFGETDDDPVTHLGGDTGHAFATIEIACIADTKAAARALRKVVRTVLIGYQGISAGVAIRGCEPTGGRLEGVADNRGGNVWRTSAVAVFEIGYQ